jgi:hypothetical protein
LPERPRSPGEGPTAADLARFPDMNPGPVLRTDMKGDVLLANRAAVDVFGEGLVGRCWYEACPGLSAEGWKSIQASTDLCWIEARVGERDFVFRHRSDPRTKLVFVYGTDVSELKQTQRALAESEPKLAGPGDRTRGDGPLSGHEPGTGAQGEHGRPGATCKPGGVRSVRPRPHGKPVAGRVPRTQRRIMASNRGVSPDGGRRSADG